MADVICRWRNATPKTVVELTNALPHKEMDSMSFRQYMQNSIYGDDFFRTPYQLACQLGLYYEDEKTFYPRFNHDIDEDEAIAYLKRWIHLYYAPNPYTKSLKGLETPIRLVESLVKQLEVNSHLDLREALHALFNDPIGNVDIVQNLLNNFSNVISIDNKGIASLKLNYKEYMENMLDRNDKKAFFHSFDDKKREKGLATHQRIYYGAPGTGKSHKVKEIAERDQDHFVRTTFHPDSDYSTFVGAYKPTTIEVAMRDVTGKIIYENGKEVTEIHIVYDFVPQAFLQAYVEAWKNYPTPEFLVIEEINRGNCAQIFGDLFQLLDRNENGFSDYYINADNDMRKHLSEEFSKFQDKFDEEKKAEINSGCKRDVVNKIFTGEIMLIPNNLYILATMNTSDQSLFPIDSAFKRRWDWVYVPIAKGVDRKSGDEFKWKIVMGTKEYDWWSFLEKINAQIGATTNSEDKKLGFFFCRAKNDEIDAETFVSKVLFYLWNDVFKDYGFDGELFKATDGNPLTFDKFYNVMRGEAVPNVENVRMFLENLGVEGSAKDNIEDMDKEEDDGEVEQDGKDSTKYSINGEGEYAKRTLAWEIVNKYVKEHAHETADQVLQAFRALKDMVAHGIETQAEHNARLDKSKVRVKEVECNGGKLYVATNGWGGREVMNRLMDFVNSQPWNMQVDEAQ